MVPDMSIHGSLSSVHCSLDLEHYQLIRGLLENNLGEPVEDFLRPYNLQDPSTYVRFQPRDIVVSTPMSLLIIILSVACNSSRLYVLTDWCFVSAQTVLSGDVYTSLSFLVDMMDVSLELLDSPTPTEHKRSLARLAFSFLP